ncbi:MAG: hypothetical protein DWQ07_17425 [Chloroflexi bacterium]|nr:MAG: hypothetical protein DWQ07_17425 [Chloroflexota bacterium]MBL1195187.1 hypothetical protein [Chloroflexota bacterium]NOH12471.1 hypothetical protein [Chloroflexota bacterium]
MTNVEIQTWLSDLLGRERCEELLSHWQKITADALDDGDDHLNLLRVSALIMNGQQLPSVITAISTASSMQSTPAWEGLSSLAVSLQSFAQVQSLSPSIQTLVQQTVVAAQEEISRSIDNAREREEQTLRSVSE